MDDGKQIFVTVGSTQFDDLIQTILSEEFLSLLMTFNYKQINLQIGHTKISKDIITKLKLKFKGIKINIFDFKKELLDDYKVADLVISHAGSGSILESLRLKKKLLVVINNKLMDNHQKELAKEMEKNKYLYTCEPNALRHTLIEIESKKNVRLKLFPEKKEGLFQQLLETLF